MFDSSILYCLNLKGYEENGSEIVSSSNPSRITATRNFPFLQARSTYS